MQLNVRTIYPNNPDYVYKTRLQRLNLDKERIDDLRRGKGFVITEPVSIKKDVKDYNGIFSTRFGQTLQDLNPFANRYSCTCKHLQGRIYHGIKCPICGDTVKYVGDEMDYFGYIILEDPYYLIHPNLFKSIEFIIGTRPLNNILTIYDPKDEDGFSVPFEPVKGEPFFGIGMTKFKERFDEVMKYYLTQNPNKLDYYKDIMENRDKIFIQSIPVYTTHLRPFRIDGTSFYFEGANEIYNVLAKLAADCNRPDLEMSKATSKPKNQLLKDMQDQYNNLYKEIEETLAKKKGAIRSLFGGRYNFTARCVIASDPKLRVNQVRLPYHALVELLQQAIINILHKSYCISYDAAYKIWYKAQINKDPRVYNIIEGMIKDKPEGLPVLINRPPTIQYGSILYMNVVGINDDYTMSVPLQILPLLAADFDGDALSILWIINESVRIRAEEVFSPRDAFYINRNDGMFDNNMNHQRDIIITACGLIEISRSNYTPKQLEKIRIAQAMEDDDNMNFVMFGSMDDQVKPGNSPLNGYKSRLGQYMDPEDAKKEYKKVFGQKIKE